MLDIRWYDASADGPIDPLAEHLAALGHEPSYTHLCPECGSDRHGAPRARGVFLSLSRSGPHVLTAVATDGPVGVDVESVAEVAARWAGSVVLAPGETATTDEAKARTWVSKEAVLKAYGVGLARPMTGVVLARERVEALPAPEGHVAAVARA